MTTTPHSHLPPPSGPRGRRDVEVSPREAAGGPLRALVVAGLAAGLSFYGLLAAVPDSGADDADSMGALGWLVLLVFAAAAVWWLVYAGAVVRESRRVLPRGRRRGALTVAVTAPVVLLLLQRWLVTPFGVSPGSSGLPSTVAFFAWLALWLGAGPAAFAWSASRHGDLVRGRIMAAGLGLTGVLPAAGVAAAVGL